MINLLEPSVRKALHLTYVLRVLATMLFLVAAAFFIGTVTLLPAYVLSLAKKSDAELSQASIAETLAKEEKEAPSAEIAALKEKLGILITNSVEGKLFSAVEVVTELRPAAITLSEIAYTAKEKGGELRIEGRSATRDELLSYQRELQKVRLFSAVELPISNLAKENNLEFAITLSGAF